MIRWPMVPLREVLYPVSRPEVVHPENSYRVLGAHWYAHGLYTKETLTGGEIQAPRVYRVEEGDFVYNRLFAWKGSFAVATAENHGCYVSNEFPCFRAKEDRLSVLYLWRYFSREKAWIEALDLSTGGTPTSRNRLKEEAFLQLTIPLPPLAEQRRLVERIDALAAKMEEAKQLRRESDHATQAFIPAHALNIFEELAKYHRIRKFAEFEPHVTSGPRNWGQRTADSGDRFYRAQDVLPGGRLATSGKVFIESPNTSQGMGARLKAGDLMIVITGATVGRVAVFPADSEPGYVSQHVAICRLDPAHLDPRFALQGLLSPYGQEQILGQRYGQGKPGLNLTNIRNLRLPVPPLPVQQRVVEHLDHLVQRIQQLRFQQGGSKEEVEAMLPAILDRAFRGEL